MTVLLATLLLIGLVAGLWAFGPREPADSKVRFDPAVIGPDPEAYVARREAATPGLDPALEKEIVWADPHKREPTTLALVYVHGFSASKGEIRPVPDLVARRLCSNLFYTRLTGHGHADQAGREMAEARVADWFDDLAEAVAIGERLGARVVLVTTSTGGTLAALALAHPHFAGRIAKVVFVSPNFRIKAPLAMVLGWPFARWIVPLVAGRERGFEPVNAAHAAYWTARYPATALLPVGALMRAVTRMRPEDIKSPALFIYNPGDTVVDGRAVAAVAARWGGPTRVIEIRDAENDHVIAGDALSPSKTAPVADAIAAWIAALS